eukprot:TRINITY_DN96_c0_g1_i1.p1 TRINITY_DN96_c0_g1~~TRINITY_DN96_c0_g1_i1.p1  ORF type:complete len:605 (-),score=220.27 TRINITY_DN96_c0_g1_i1:21-1835(-)
MLFVFLLFLACASAFEPIKLGDYVNHDLQLTAEGKEFLEKLGSEPAVQVVLGKTQDEAELAAVFVNPAPVPAPVDTTQLEQEISQLKEQVQQLEQQKQQQTEQLAQQTQKTNEYEQKIEQLEQQTQKAKEFEQKIEQLEQQAQKTKEYEQKIEQLEQQTQKAKEFEQKIEQLEQQAQKTKEYEQKIEQLEQTGKVAQAQQQLEKLVSEATKVYADSVTGKAADNVKALEKIHEEANTAALSAFQTASADVSPALVKEGLEKLNANILAHQESFSQSANTKWIEAAKSQLQALWVAEMKELEATSAVYEKAKAEVQKKFEEATQGLPSKLTTGSWNDFLSVIESDPIRQSAFVAGTPSDAVFFSLVVIGFHFLWTHIKSRFPRFITLLVALFLMPAVIGASLLIVSELGFAPVESLPGMDTYVPIATSLGAKLNEKLPVVYEFTAKYTEAARPVVEEHLKTAQKHFATVSKTIDTQLEAAKPAIEKFTASAQALAADIPVHANAALASAKKHAENASPIIAAYYEKASATVSDLAKSAQPAAENFIASAKVNVEKLSASAKPAVENFIASAQPALAGVADSAKAFVGTATEKVNKIIADLTKKEL